MALELFFTIFLVLLNGFFVAAEFAIVKVRSSQIALQKGSLSKKFATIIIDNLDGFLAATQLGITIASLALGWVGEDVVSTLVFKSMHNFGFDISEAASHQVGIIIAFAVITIMHIVFGELAPKSIAIRYPTATTLAISVPLRVFYFIFRPFIRLLNGFSILVLKVMGIKPISETEIHSEDELKLIIAESEEGGAIESSERELIQNVFDFDDRLVKQVMIPRMKISGIPISSTLEEAVSIVFREGYSRYPVYDKGFDEIMGVAYSKDILKNYVEKSGKTLTEVMHKAYYITETKRIDHVLREFQKRKVQMAVVISEYGGTIGLITLEDIIEELIGDIQDEHDHETQIVTSKGANVYQVIATSSLHDINKILEEPFQDSEEYETLAGLLLFHKPSELKEGDELTIEGYKIRI